MWAGTRRNRAFTHGDSLWSKSSSRRVTQQAVVASNGSGIRRYRRRRSRGTAPCSDVQYGFLERILDCSATEPKGWTIATRWRTQAQAPSPRRT